MCFDSSCISISHIHPVLSLTPPTFSPPSILRPWPLPDCHVWVSQSAAMAAGSPLLCSPSCRWLHNSKALLCLVSGFVCLSLSMIVGEIKQWVRRRHEGLSTCYPAVETQPAHAGADLRVVEEIGSSFSAHYHTGICL
ncbi:hypothetical protein QQF64_013679 [Cirrhinus molitorella]|uniref:Uncharacterized protein n=1 Tax=Cirrhinus molitorella TaxID=172907 RepID=A0ABR3LW11_9TELE